MITEEDKELLKSCIDISMGSVTSQLNQQNDPAQKLQGRNILAKLLNLSTKVDSFPIDKPKLKKEE